MPVKKALMLCLFALPAFSQGGTFVGGNQSASGTTTNNGSTVTVTSISVTPNTAGQSANVNSTFGLTATVTLSDGSTANVTSAAIWTISNGAIASFDSLTTTENMKCISAGTVTFTATYGGSSGTSTWNCVGVLPPPPTPVSLSLTPQGVSINAGQAAQYTVTELMSDGSTPDITARAQFVSGTPSIATIGPLTATREVDCTSSGGGSSVISASADSLTSATSTITCNATLSTITVAPASPIIVAGNTQPFIATCNYSDGSSKTCAAPTWSSSNTATATITSAGVATGSAAGTTTIKAQIGSVSGTTTLTVTSPGPPPPTQTSTSIAPVNKTININTTLQYAATAVFSDGSSAPCTATWASTSPSVATIGASTGLASGVANGSTTIQGTCNAILGSTTLTVQTPAPTLSSVTVTPPNQTQYNGSTVQFTATATYSDGSTQNVTSLASWTSGTPAVATIGASTGLATCVANSGTTVITATFQATPGTTNLSCQPASTNTAENAYCNTNGTPIGPATDGPAAMPTACMDTDLSNTPSPGITRGPDTNTASVQADINAAACGDTILVTAGSTLSTITLPHKGCDSAHWITIKSTGVTNGLFPAEHVRGTPCMAGVASMPSRPAYPCPTPTLLSFSITAPPSSSAILQSGGADHYRIIGAEITRSTTPHTIYYSLIDLSGGGTQANNIIFDRVWCHGPEGTFPQTSSTDTSTTRCLYLGQSNHIAFINSTISNIYNNGATATNGNTDSQCVGGGVGSIQNSGWGVYKFYNNHAECGSEGLILGGSAGPALSPPGCTFGVNCNLDVPQNIEVRNNYFFAPNFWNGNTSTINATGYPNRKNGVEFKTGANILLEGNVFENCWYSSQPYCYVFDFAPKNQSNAPATRIVGICPSCLVQDFVARYNYGYNYPGDMIAIYSTQDIGCTNCTTLGRRGSVHDNLVGDKLNKGSLTLTGFDGIEFLATAGPMTQITINHNSVVNGWRSFLLMSANTNSSGSSGYNQMVIQDNIGTYTPASQGAPYLNGGGCSGSSTFLTFLTTCITTWTLDHNVVFNTANLSGWPLGNFFQASAAGVQFTNYGTGDSNFNPGNYSLLTSSPYHNAGSDGKDIGADITTLLQKIAGVRQ